MLRPILLLCVLSAGFAVDNTPIDTDLSVPRILRVIEREFEAIVEFTEDYRAREGDEVGRDSFPRRVDSYLIEWGPSTQNFPLTIRQVRPVAQMQLLDDNILYRGRVFHIGKNRGRRSMRKSRSSQIFFFRSRSGAINILRRDLNSFFDDFNGDAGDFDERRWNVAFSACAKSKTTNFNVNVQRHMHTQLGSLGTNCPGESMTARARGIFRFAGRTGKIFVDVDGPAFPDQQFFLSLSARAHDLYQGVDVTNAVSIVQDNSQMWVEQIDASGRIEEVPNTKTNLFTRGDNTYSTANVRRPWVWDVNVNDFSLRINGRLIYNRVSWPQVLTFTSGHVSMTHAHIQSQQSGSEVVTMHSDNFGFDGPRQTFQTLNFRNVEERSMFRNSRSINLDMGSSDIDDIVAARLMFTITANPAFARGVHAVQFNGLVLDIPAVAAAIDSDTELEGTNVVINIPNPARRVSRGRNVVRFGTFGTSGRNIPGLVGNVHVELDFSCNSRARRTYTPPNSKCIFASSGFPVSFNCDLQDLPRPVVHFAGRQAFSVAGGRVRAEITMDIDTGRVLRHAGGSKGLNRIEVLVDCRVQQTVPLDGAAFRIRNFRVDVDYPASGGRSEVWIRAVNNAGESSVLLSDGDFANFQTGRSFSPDGQRDENYRPLLVNNQRSAPARVVERSFNEGCNFRQAFTGGRCPDTCVFTAGLRGPSVCLGSSGQEILGEINGNSTNSTPRHTLGARPQARPLLYQGWRREDGYFGDWHQDPEYPFELPSWEDPGLRDQPNQLDACRNQTFVDQTFPQPECDRNETDASEYVPAPQADPDRPSWLNRDLVPPYLEQPDDDVVALLNEMYPQTTDPSSAWSLCLPLSSLLVTLMATC